MKPLEITCPKCLAQPGARCTNYKGQNKPTCRERTLTAEHRAPETIVRVRDLGEQLGFLGVADERLELRTVELRAPVRRGSVGVTTGRAGMVVSVFAAGRCIHSETVPGYGQVRREQKLAIARSVLGPDAHVTL